MLLLGILALGEVLVLLLLLVLLLVLVLLVLVLAWRRGVQEWSQVVVAVVVVAAGHWVHTLYPLLRCTHRRRQYVLHTRYHCSILLQRQGGMEISRQKLLNFYWMNKYLLVCPSSNGPCW